MGNWFNKFVITLLLLITISFSAVSQKEVRKQLREGNKEYKQDKFTESEISYRKALEANAQSVDAAYNLGNALYKQGKYPEALQQYQAVTLSGTDAKMLAATYHNIGNIFMTQQDYAKSVTAYKLSLRNNPNDNETRYNLALAKKLLDEQQQNQDKDKDKKEQEKQKQEQEKKEQEQQDKQEQEQQNNKEDKTQEEQQQNEQMSRDNAQQILDALLQDEKDTQEKVKEAQMRQMKSRKTEKDW